MVRFFERVLDSAKNARIKFLSSICPQNAYRDGIKSCRNSTSTRRRTSLSLQDFSRRHSAVNNLQMAGRSSPTLSASVPGELSAILDCTTSYDGRKAPPECDKSVNASETLGNNRKQQGVERNQKPIEPKQVTMESERPQELTKKRPLTFPYPPPLPNYSPASCCTPTTCGVRAFKGSPPAAEAGGHLDRCLGHRKRLRSACASRRCPSYDTAEAVGLHA